MSVTERRLKATVMDAEQIRRSLSRIAHEIVERNHGAGEVVLVGVFSRGDHLARRLAAQLEELEGHPIVVGAIDTSEHRDDRHLREPAHRFKSDVPDVDGKVVVLVDDVIHRGRTARGGRGRFSWRSSSTAAIASCRSAPTTWARTCRPRTLSASRCWWPRRTASTRR